MTVPAERSAMRAARDGLRGGRGHSGAGGGTCASRRRRSQPPLYHLVGRYTAAVGGGSGECVTGNGRYVGQRPTTRADSQVRAALSAQATCDVGVCTAG
eukprot:5313296-Prymnesium_polylepis.1